LSKSDGSESLIFDTVTTQVAEISLPSLAVAVIVAVPSAIAVIVPLATVAIDSSEEVQFKSLRSASKGVTVASITEVSPTDMFASDLLRAIAFTRFSHWR